jgi:hypothetical protein
VIELAAPLGKECVFKGSLVMRFASDAIADVYEAAFTKAIKLVPAIGALKSAGFGEVIAGGSSIVRTSNESLVPARPSAAAHSGIFEVEFDRPLLVDAIRVAGNIFQSSKVVPGAAFKGALAEVLMLAGHNTQTGDLADNLARLRISHARPVDNDGKPLELPTPMSWVVRDPKGRCDVADLSAWPHGVGAIAPAAAGMPPKALEFVSGAKNSVVDKVRSRAGLIDLDATFLTRTQVAIDAATMAAEETKLFSALLLETSGHRWRLAIDYSAVTDATHAAMFHAILSGGLAGRVQRRGCAMSARRLRKPPGT